jgi:adenosylmethionine-8-amino-7-oxononanoate aminotransferase
MTFYKHPLGNVFYRKMGHARPMVSHGEGIFLYDRDGNKYLDGSGGAIVANVGHGRSDIAHAVMEQMSAAAYVHATMFTSEALENYATALAKHSPISSSRYYFLSSGSEVVEGAMKLARQIQMARGENERNLIIGRNQSYHGLTLGALSVSDRQFFRQPYTEMFREMPHIRPPYPYRDPADGEEAAARLEEAILKYGKEKVAAFIAEPISGASLGAVVPPSSYWPSIRQICNHYGVLLIADEVMTGFGRTGTWWGLNHWQVTPDIMVSSKGAAGGYFPLGFIAAAGDDVELLASKLGDFSHGGTFSHHAVGGAAGLETLRIIEREGLVDNAARMGALLGAQLQMTLGHHPMVGDIRGRGLLWAVEIVQDKRTKVPFLSKHHVAQGIAKKAFEIGLIVYTSQGCADGVNGDLILLGPPLIIEELEIEVLTNTLSEAIKAFF